MEDGRRANLFNERMSTQNSFGQLYAADAGRKIKEEAIREEQRTLRDIEKKFKSDDDRERMKQETRKREILRSVEVNRELDERKKQAKEIERANGIKMRLKFEEENRVEEAKKAKLLREKQVVSKATREMLDAQVSVRMQGVKNEAALTALEVALNRVSAMVYCDACTPFL